MHRGTQSGAERRVDDNEETLKKRLHTYVESTMPVIEHFDKSNMVRRVDATKDVDDVWKQIEAILNAQWNNTPTKLF